LKNAARDQRSRQRPSCRSSTSTPAATAATRQDHARWCPVGRWWPPRREPCGPLDRQFRRSLARLVPRQPDTHSAKSNPCFTIMYARMRCREASCHSSG
jgi:hypothetical protein